MRRGKEKRAIFGKAMRIHRKAAGLSQEDLGEAAMSSREWISAIERGLVSPNCVDTLLIIRALGLTEHEFDDFLSLMVDVSEYSQNPKVEARRLKRNQ